MNGRVIKGQIVKDNVRMGIGEYFWRTADKFGDRICQIDGDTLKQETFAEVRSRAVKVAVHLKKMGVKPKDVVMVCSENDLDHIVPVLAALFIGACVASCAPSTELKHLYYMLNDIKPKVVFTISKQVAVVEGALNKLDLNVKLIVMGQSSIYQTMYEMEKTETDEEQLFKPATVKIHDPAFLMFTSGTTASPRGLYLSHFALLAGACRYNENQSILVDTPFILPFASYWISSVFITMFTFIFAMPRLVAPFFTEEQFYRLVEKYKVEYCFFWPDKIAQLADMDQEIIKKYDVFSMKVFFAGGLLVDTKYIKKIMHIFPSSIVLQNYGTTEIGATPITMTANNFQKGKFNSLGKATENMEVKIVDPETRQLLGPNQQGEILVKSPYKMIGFAGNRDSRHLFDEDGFYKTGDIGYYDEDEYFYFVERLDQIFKVDGVKVCPALAEGVLKLHPAIKEAVIFGIPYPGNNRCCACVVLNKDANATAQEISDYLVNHLGEIYHPAGGVKFLKEIPITSTGKVARKKVKELFINSS